jgi:hypothetical protein
LIPVRQCQSHPSPGYVMEQRIPLEPNLVTSFRCIYMFYQRGALESMFSNISTWHRPCAAQFEKLDSRMLTRVERRLKRPATVFAPKLCDGFVVAKYVLQHIRPARNNGNLKFALFDILSREPFTTRSRTAWAHIFRSLVVEIFWSAISELRVALYQAFCRPLTTHDCLAPTPGLLQLSSYRT